MAAELFETHFGKAPEARHFSPGRVNLIGEHTDYNGGMVLPTALKLGVSIALTPRDDSQVNIISDKFDGTARRSILDKAQSHWADYVVGAIKAGVDAGLLSGGADIALTTDLPFGAGLSSSAAVIVGLLKVVRQISGSKITDADIAILARKVENEFIGVPCGIMDQMAIALARPGQALALDTDTLAYELIELPKSYHMAVIHSGVFRQLSEGRYKIRKEECDIIKVELGREDICLMSDAELKLLSALAPNIQRRAKHCQSEHRRTVEATAALQSENMAVFGKLMIESHISMRDDFEITVPKIDHLVEDVVGLGALGARMTGGGFGGCIVACVPSADLENWTAALLEKHKEAFFVC